MERARGPALYSPALLALAVELADHPFDPAAALQGEARSRTCGSTVALSIIPDQHGAIAEAGARVSACAVGQAAAAIFLAAAPSRSAKDIAAAEAALAAWLAGEGAMPDWPRLAMLTPALSHRGRHDAILLPWRAARAALCNRDGGG